MLESVGCEARRSFISFSFTLVVDVLGRLVSRVANNGMVKGLPIGSQSVLVSHLQFADDTMFFLELDVDFC